MKSGKTIVSYLRTSSRTATPATRSARVWSASSRRRQLFAHCKSFHGRTSWCTDGRGTGFARAVQRSFFTHRHVPGYWIILQFARRSLSRSLLRSLPSSISVRFRSSFLGAQQVDLSYRGLSDIECPYLPSRAQTKFVFIRSPVFFSYHRWSESGRKTSEFISSEFRCVFFCLILPKPFWKKK